MLNLKSYKHVHCIGIGGIGLSAIAEILIDRGYIVSGSDVKPSELTAHLASLGATIYYAHAARNIKGADLVVYSAAVSKENPEIMAAEVGKIETASRAAVLGALMDDYSTSIAISGTHGKTTTTSMVSLILRAANLNPTILVGGTLPDINGNVEVGKGDYFVTEACEYMDSFLSLRPRIEIILNIDSDHLDYFKDIDHIANSFERFADLVPEDGLVVAFEANPFVNSIIDKLKCKVVTFGFNDNCTYYARDIKFNAKGLPAFDIFCNGEHIANIQLSVPGEHNILNAMAAFATCHKLGVPTDIIVTTLSDYSGTQRRFDILGATGNNVKIVDDYAHHPTEIRATLKAAQNVPHNRLWCVFQPHTYTRAIALFDEFTTAFDNADVLILTEIYAAREKNIYKISSKELVTEIKKKYPGKEVYYFSDFNEIANFLGNNTQNGDLVITMGAGDIYKVAELLLEK